MATRGLGREQIHDVAWQESYPHPFVSFLMPGIAILAFTALILTGFSAWQWSLPRDTTVPPIEGLSRSQAEQELHNAGLQIQVEQQQRTSETVPAGSVIIADPAGGRRVKVGRLVTLVVSAGSAFTTIPDVSELPQSEARERLTKAGLRIDAEQYQYHETIPYDRIISITPKPGIKVKRDATVSLIISEGPTPTEDNQSDGQMRSSTVTVDLPTDVKGPAEARIDVTDDNGKQTVYQEQRSPGETLVETVQGTGAMTVEVYFANRLILTRKL